jgi:hypothetical protein
MIYPNGFANYIYIYYTHPQQIILHLPFYAKGRCHGGTSEVFKITDTPIIHSAGWHFRFNAGLKLATVNIKDGREHRKIRCIQINIRIFQHKLGWKKQSTQSKEEGNNKIVQIAIFHWQASH